MKPEDIATFLLLVGLPVALVAFVIIRDRRKQGARRIPLSQIVENVTRSADEFVGSIFSVIGIIMWFIFIVAVIFAGLWLVVASVKWMWRHS